MINVLYSSLVRQNMNMTYYCYGKMTLFILSTHVYDIIIVCFLYHFNVHCISYIPREGSLFGE